MSVQFGNWNFDGAPVTTESVDRAVSSLVPYGPDSGDSYSDRGVVILYRAFHTTRESRDETQPFKSGSGIVVTWDGRLDNRLELADQLGLRLATGWSDVEIVAEAYKRWEKLCFAKLIGDWAVSIWTPVAQSLVLAKDPIGTRHLYYSQDDTQIKWSSLLEPLVLGADQSLRLNEEYIAGCLAFFPAPHVTPYVGIHSVPPSSFVQLARGTRKVIKYWDFDAFKQIRYRTDEEYEDHFRSAFGEAVRRRLRSDVPILAELSGGMDSSSIVCMSDVEVSSGHSEAPRVDTVSYVDDSEPNWDERPYFSRIEQNRGRVGCHIDVSSQALAQFEFDDSKFPVTPSSDGGKLSDAARELIACMAAQGNRVVLSGTGGDEVTGGVPTAIPELQNLVARFHLKLFVHQLKIWALQKRKPWFHLLRECLHPFLFPPAPGRSARKDPERWLRPEFARRNQDVLDGYPKRTRFLGPLPSTQDSLTTLDGVRRQLAFDVLSCEPLVEKRYPFLDRSFLEFVYAVPREQLIRPGQRRSLMRRSLMGIVPEEVIKRKRKAFVSRRPLVSISSQWPQLVALSQDMVSASLGIVDAEEFRKVLTKAREGIEVPIVRVMRTLEIEGWLRRWEHWRQSRRVELAEAQMGSGGGNNPIVATLCTPLGR